MKRHGHRSAAILFIFPFKPMQPTWAQFSKTYKPTNLITTEKRTCLADPVYQPLSERLNR